MFLSAEELSQLTGYAPNQRTRVRKWLTEHGIPYTENRLGYPVVLRSAIENKTDTNAHTPNFEWLKAG